MEKYKKKPVVIEAKLLTIETIDEIEKWIDNKRVTRHYNNEQDWLQKHNPQGLFIPTLEGDMLGRIGDFIIKGINGEFYPCKPDIFEKTYDKVFE